MYSLLAVGSHVSIKGTNLAYRNRIGLYQLVKHCLFGSPPHNIEINTY